MFIALIPRCYDNKKFFFVFFVPSIIAVLCSGVLRVGYTRGHLHVRVDEHKQRSSSLYKHYKDKHDKIHEDLLRRFDVL